MSHFTEMSTMVLTQGLIYSLVAMAVYLTSRIIRFDDLTVEGSFGIGGAIAGQILLMHCHPLFTLLAAPLVGALAGLATGLLHNKLGMNNLISGIVVTTALFSLCLATVGANVSFMDNATVLSSQPLIVLLVIAALTLIGIGYLLRSQLGFLLRALGENPHMLTHLGKSQQGYQIGALMLANALTATAGALFVQLTGFYSITGNVGTLVIGLSSLILGEVLVSRSIIKVLIGAILYQAVFALTLELQVAPQWNNLIKAGLIIFLIALQQKRKLPC